MGYLAIILSLIIGIWVFYPSSDDSKVSNNATETITNALESRPTMQTIGNSVQASKQIVAGFNERQKLISDEQAELLKNQKDLKKAE